MGFQPVLLGSQGDDLKRPQLKGWPTAVYTPEEVVDWPPANNLGIRCGQQENDWALTVFDFDEEATRIFPAWRQAITRFVNEQLVVVASHRGYHVYVYTETPQTSCTLAGRYVVENGRRRLLKLIETLGTGRLVVSAGSRHPSGWQYRFLGSYRYADIPFLTEEQYQACVTVARTFEERPPRPVITAVKQRSQWGDVQNCLEYARCYIGSPEKVEPNGDIRFLGQGGLLITANGRAWYSFSEDIGGGLRGLIAWHQGGGLAT
jgi:hypothetical protein